MSESREHSREDAKVKGGRMKVQIVGLGYSASMAKVTVKTPRGSSVEIALHTHKVLTKKELTEAIQNTFNQLEEMGKRVQVVKDLMFTDIEVKGGD